MGGLVVLVGRWVFLGGTVYVVRVKGGGKWCPHLCNESVCLHHGILLDILDLATHASDSPQAKQTNSTCRGGGGGVAGLTHRGMVAQRLKRILIQVPHEPTESRHVVHGVGVRG